MSRTFVRRGFLFGVALCGSVLVACSRSPLDIEKLPLTAGQLATEAPGTPDDPLDPLDPLEPEPPPDEVGPPDPEAPEPEPPACLPGTGDFIYMMTDTLGLHRFDPRSGRAQAIGRLDCAGRSESAFSMAVDRSGRAIVLLRSGGFDQPGQLVRASTLHGRCERIFDYEPGQRDFGLFGMAFTGDPESDGETLYVHGGELRGGAGLGEVDTEAWVISPVGRGGQIGAAELAGTPEGRLLALFTRSANWDAWFLAELDRRDGTLLWERPLPALPITADVDAFAVAFWDGNLYAFLSRQRPSGDPETTVLRNALDRDDFESIAVLPLRIVGVGATTCAPNPLARD